ncbi:MAG: nucleotidyl transferase AbiEii/AbiGii toxin family protein [Ignavibacteriales bacterium]|nr:nucleotidyl transferase AbiEii/AbiGii toxin family protein [Ignavibacteriales bacterium]
MLDILFEESQYKNLVEQEIRSSFLPEKGYPVIVKTASLEDILGDKLTAFAPNTTGIPYFKGKDNMSMEIIKQLFDIGNLFDNVTDLETVKITFKIFAEKELEYREMNDLSERDVLEDIYQTGLCIVTRGSDGRGDFDQLRQGILRVSGFIFSENYHIEKAIIHASKTAYLAALIKHDAGKIQKYSHPSEMKDWFINEPLNLKLNRLKKSNPESFFYWYKIYELETFES